MGWLSVAAAAVVLTGCLVADVGVEVNEDGSGKVVVEVYPSDEFRDRLRQLDLEDLEQLSRTDGAQIELSEIGTIGRRGYRIEVPFDDYRVLNTAGEGGIRFGGADIRLFSTFGLTEANGFWTLSAELRPLDEVVTTLRQVLGVGTVDNRPEVNLSITLPGRVIRSNSDTQEGGTARWTFDFSEPVTPANSATRLEMRTEPVPLVTPAQWVLIAAAAVVLAGAALVVVTSNRGGRGTGRSRRRRRRRSEGDTGWSKAPVDAPKGGQSVVAPPLPWQTYKPGEEPEGAVPAPSTPPATSELPPMTVAPPSMTSPSAGPPASVTVPEGWYQDPEDPSRLRWWDGADWSGHTSDWV
jgi:hypothetical protein